MRTDFGWVRLYPNQPDDDLYGLEENKWVDSIQDSDYTGTILVIPKM